ncbi:MAG: hypothetical protein B7C24_04455 [Bacteroidetes bacterium 4572_77]|nr:MAG: hypothetical protein B7C24_04455 [Bacteroidetes bacterium 4572_77]
MAKGLIEYIVKDLKSYSSEVLLVEDNEGFLFREDVVRQFLKYNIVVSNGSKLSQRIALELKEDGVILLLVSKSVDDYLADIYLRASSILFSLKNYINSYHIPTLVNLDIAILEPLFAKESIAVYDKRQTLIEVEKLREQIKKLQRAFYDLNSLTGALSLELAQINKDWSKIIKLISEALVQCIGTSQYEDLLVLIDQANAVFQQDLKADFKPLQSSSFVKKPKIVSKILDYLDFNFKQDKIALIVVDGLAYWQYLLFNKQIQSQIKEDVVYSWIPSTTQLSRQAIFKGDHPYANYQQNPRNENRLWQKYWASKGIPAYQVKYDHERCGLENLNSITKYALVFKDLDEKMHSSTDYKDLFGLTENWIERSRVVHVITSLLSKGFKVFLTTDHGNIQAKGWKRLTGRQKLGANKSGSRSERHIEYSEEWLADEFIKKNPTLVKSIMREENAIYMKDDLSFSNKPTLVSHGGSHLLEVLIPFIELNYEK